MSDEVRQAEIDEMEQRYSRLRRESVDIRTRQDQIEAVIYSLPAKYDVLLDLEKLVRDFVSEEWWSTIGQIEQRPSGCSFSMFINGFNASLAELDRLKGVTYAQEHQLTEPTE